MRAHVPAGSGTKYSIVKFPAVQPFAPEYIAASWLLMNDTAFQCVTLCTCRDRLLGGLRKMQPGS